MTTTTSLSKLGVRSSWALYRRAIASQFEGRKLDADMRWRALRTHLGLLLSWAWLSGAADTYREAERAGLSLDGPEQFAAEPMLVLDEALAFGEWQEAIEKLMLKVPVLRRHVDAAVRRADGIADEIIETERLFAAERLARRSGVISRALKSMFWFTGATNLRQTIVVRDLVAESIRGGIDDVLGLGVVRDSGFGWNVDRLDTVKDGLYWVDTRRVEAAWRGSRGYVTPTNGIQIDTRIQEPIQAVLTGNGIRIEDAGRFAGLRDRGVKRVVIRLPKTQRRLASRMLGVRSGLTLSEFVAEAGLGIRSLATPDGVQAAMGITSARLEVILRNNTASVYNDARVESLDEPDVVGILPLSMIIEIQDDRTRGNPEGLYPHKGKHFQMHGYLAKPGRLRSQGIIPPAGHNCRGSVRGVTLREALSLGVAREVRGEIVVQDDLLAEYNRTRQQYIDNGEYPDPGWLG